MESGKGGGIGRGWKKGETEKEARIRRGRGKSEKEGEYEEGGGTQKRKGES